MRLASYIVCFILVNVETTNSTIMFDGIYLYDIENYQFIRKVHKATLDGLDRHAEMCRRWSHLVEMQGREHSASNYTYLEDMLC